MVLIQARKFLGCLALGTGVWILCLLSFVLGITGAVIGWLEILVLASHPLPLEDKVLLFTRTIVLSLLVLLSVVGIAVGISKRTGLTFIYSKMIASHCILLLVALAFTLVLTFRPVSDAIVDRCTNGSSNHMIVEFCTPGWSLVQGASVCIVGVSVLVQIYAFIIASNFAEQLDLETAMLFPDLSSFTNDKFPPLGSFV